jgi:hypothetical protein
VFYRDGVSGTDRIGTGGTPMTPDKFRMHGFRFRMGLIRAALSRRPACYHNCQWEWLAYSNKTEADGWRRLYEEQERRAGRA